MKTDKITCANCNRKVYERELNFYNNKETCRFCEVEE